MFTSKKCQSASILIFPNSQDNEKAYIHFDVGMVIKKVKDGKDVSDTVTGISINERRMAVEIRYSLGSKVVYKGYHFIYTL